MRFFLKAFIVILVLAGGIYLYLRPAPADPAAGKKDNAPVPVLAARSETGDLAIVVDLVGRGEAYESVSLKARVDGQVQAVPFREGQHVKAGEILLRLDPADFNARLRQAEANQARDQAQLQKAHADVTRYQALQQQGFVSVEKLADLNAVLAAAEATVQADRAATELARLQLSYATVRAPIDGVVGARLVFPGTAVKTNDTVLAVVNRIQPLLVSFALPERHLGPLRAALAKGPIAATVSTPDGAGQALTAAVSFVDNAVDPGTGTLLMKARLDNRDERFSAGQYLRVELVLDTLKDAVTVPTEAIQQGSKGTVVYTVTPDMGIDIRPVRIVAERSGRVALTGLLAGTMVVTDGHLRLTPKSRVKINMPEAAPPLPAAGQAR
ncbi:MAG: efflux RND transporter periplasmic adaptor subunit [Gallionellaceae bacterium]|nr:efflux RND transporter periplasmic adaptor subunit [Gallionellaceae bacterium]